MSTHPITEVWSITQTLSLCMCVCHQLMQADYRLQCYTSAWWGNAVYAIVVSVAYVVGYPLMVIALLLSHRKTLNVHDSSCPPRLHLRAASQSCHTHTHTL